MSPTDAAIAGWDESGLPGLMESLTQFDQVQQQQISEGIARRRVVALGPEGALRWADELAENPLKNVLSLRVASAVASDKNDAAIRVEGKLLRQRGFRTTRAQVRCRRRRRM